MLQLGGLTPHHHQGHGFPDALLARFTYFSSPGQHACLPLAPDTSGEPLGLQRARAFSGGAACLVAFLLHANWAGTGGT